MARGRRMPDNTRTVHDAVAGRWIELRYNIRPQADSSASLASPKRRVCDKGSRLLHCYRKGLLGVSAGFWMYRVQGQSMAPALLHGDYVLVRALRKPARQPRRGDVVVVAMTEVSHIKRVVGLPGESLVFTEGTLLVDGSKLSEPYLRGLPSYLGLEAFEYSLAADAYFVMGDNRAHSTDSRHFGPVSCSQVEGTVVWALWRPLRAGRNVT